MVVICNLNQWVFDWEGNLNCIVESIYIVKVVGVWFCVGFVSCVLLMISKCSCLIWRQEFEIIGYFVYE